MKLVRSTILVAAAAVATLVPTAAHADRYVFADAAGDVVSGVGDSTTYTPAPDRTVGDIVSSTVIHKRRNVVLSLQYRDLAADTEDDAHVFFIRTNRMRRNVTLYATGDLPGGRAVMTRPNGTKVRCHVARRIDYNLNTATVVVPRSCLGKPRWVKVGMGGVMFTGISPTDTSYLDDARTNGVVHSALVYGPRVFR
jgi:hypothetical protein